MAKFDDCESCAFYDREPAICEECEDADQWEPDEEGDWGDMLRIRGYYRKTIRIRKWEEARALKRQADPQLELLAA